MIIRIVKLSIDPLKLDEFLSKFEFVKRDIRTFQGCRHLELLVDSSGSGIVFTYSYWDSLQAIEGYRNSPLFKSVWINVKPMFIAKAEAWSLEKLQEIGEE